MQEKKDQVKNNSSKIAAVVVVFITMLSISIPYTTFAQNVTDNASSSSSSSEEAEQDPISLINSIKSLLSDVSTEYNNQNYTGAEQLAQIAYLDHYEYLEAPLEERDPELMETTEHLLREELIQSIQDEADVVVVEGLISNITSNLNEAEALFTQ